MRQFLNSSPAVHGTAGGAFVGFLVNISSGDLLRTSILAAIGAVVSFAVSLSLRMLVRKRQKRG